MALCGGTERGTARNVPAELKHAHISTAQKRRRRSSMVNTTGADPFLKTWQWTTTSSCRLDVSGLVVVVVDHYLELPPRRFGVGADDHGDGCSEPPGSGVEI